MGCKGMWDRIRNTWEGLRSGLWLVPVGMGLLAFALSRGALMIDAAVPDAAQAFPRFLHGGSGDDARNLLTALVTALLSLAGVMFSITMVVLTLAANQYGPRLVRTYTGDLKTQAALGTFILTVVYCLLVLRAVGKDMPAEAVPQVAVTLGLVLAMLCLLALLMFLGVVTRLIVADAVIARVAEELDDVISGLPPAADTPAPECAGPEHRVAADGETHPAIIRSRDEGYVQSIDCAALVAAAERAGALIRLDYRAGAFMCREGWLARVQPADAVTPDLSACIRRAIIIGVRRTPTQDLEFSVRHLVDVALRALSPGINDPNTALAVIDRLRGALARIMARRLPGAVHRDRSGAVRLLVDGTDFDGLMNAAFHQIRQAGAAKPAVAIHLLGSIARLAEHVRTPRQHRTLLRHAEMSAAAGLRHAEDPNDKADIGAALAATRGKLAATAPDSADPRARANDAGPDSFPRAS
ncbi:DUF2254 domain-containing protein [Azospirillum halopraeferens]|uniref:DUF2254 domain-containing protein n=1 Tax=Azospirillum halopraeferens TaxID=34010 RepID=UPI0004088885|nr:DUF2254 domain-containing protein [Azospirillum halopraeferens]